MRGLRKVGAIVALGLASILPSERIGTLENILSPPFSIAQNIGDGSNEPGYVSPPTDSKQIAPPPANMSGGESFIPYPPPPAAPQSRSEKKNPPKPATMFTKITDDQYDSNARPADLDVLCKELKAKANVDYSWETKRLEEVSPDPDNNPILVYTKYNRYSFSETERKVLREFVLRGGTLILPPGGGSAPAYNSAVIESAKILPEASSQKISKDHPILHSYYDLDSVNVSFGNKVIEPEITISTVDCRAAIIIPKEGIDSCSGEFREGIDKVLLPEDAQKLGMNILAYASAERKWQESLKGEAVLQDKTDGLAGKLYVAQIIYNGEWKTRHAGLRKELAYFNQVSGVPVKFNQRDIRLTDKGLFDSPLIFITGHEHFVLKPDEKKNLREYLQNGGMLFAEACCGRRGFDESFRRELNNLIPGETLTPVLADSTLFKMPYQIGKMRVTPALESMIKSPIMNPQLLVLNHEGKDVVIYSPIGMQTGWELSSDCYSRSYLPEDSIKLGANILLKAMTR